MRESFCARHEIIGLILFSIQWGERCLTDTDKLENQLIAWQKKDTRE